MKILIYLVLMATLSRAACGEAELARRAGISLTKEDQVKGLLTIYAAARQHFAWFDRLPRLDWDEAFVEYLPRVEQEQTLYEYYRVLQRFVALLEDGHTSVRLPEGVQRGLDLLPFQLAFIEGQWVVVERYAVQEILEEELPVGSVLTSIDGVPATTYFREQVYPYVPAGSEHLKQSSVNWAARFARGTSIPLEFRYPDGSQHRRVLRANRSTASWSSDLRRKFPLRENRPTFFTKRLPDDILLVRNGLCDSGAEKQFCDLISSIGNAWPRALILDLRDNPGGDTPQRLISHLLSQPTRVWQRRTRCSISELDGQLRRAKPSGASEQSIFEAIQGAIEHGDLPKGYSRGWMSSEGILQPAAVHYDGPLYVLVNGQTASAAEDVAAMLQGCGRAAIIGAATAGSTGNTIRFDLPGGGDVRICAVQVKYADGRDFVPMGVRPDVRISRTIQGVIQGRDEALDAALALARQRPERRASPALDSRPTKILLTGNEQAIVDRFTGTERKPSATQFPNSLDHALTVLLARTFPPPQQQHLVKAAVASMAEAYGHQTAKTITIAQRESWVSAIMPSGSFESFLGEMASPGLHREQLVEAGLAGMLGATGWSSACVLSVSQAEELRKMNRARAVSTEERGMLGIQLERWPVAQVLPGSPAAEAGLRDGDILVSVDGADTSSAKTIPEQLKLLQGPPGAVSKLMVRRAGQTFTLAVKRTSVAAAGIRFEELEPGILLIKIPTFEGSGIAEKVKGFVEKQKAFNKVSFIIDLRDNGGGRPEEANGVADLFLSDRLLQVCEFREGTRIAFKSHPGGVDSRVILLANKGTGSAAEMLVMALRDNSRATVVGETTAGALFGKDIAELVGGQTIFFRIAPTVLSPTGRDYSLTGIPPDVAVLATTGGDTDHALARALKIARPNR